MTTPAALQNFILRAQKVFKGIWGRPSTPSSPSLPSTDGTSNELSQLAKEMDRLNASNTGIHSLGKGLRGPVTFVDVVHPNPILHAVIIFIQPGHIIPLHDHPGMFGLIKVLHGQFRIRSYTLTAPQEEGKLINGEKTERRKVHLAVRSPDVTLNSTSFPEVITPEVRNIHEIECIGGEGEHNYAAFLDVLSPPYNDELEDACHYFESSEKDPRKPYDGGGANDSESRQIFLKETRCPKSYVTASLHL